MKFNSFLGDMRMASQPERLTFHNMAYVFSTCEEPRVTFDDKTGITDVWAANDVVSNKLSNIFWDIQTGGTSHKFLGLDVYPILYLVSSEERKSMEGIETLENKYILSAVMLTYRVEHISNKTNPTTKTVANYSIILEQSLDGFLVTLKQVMVMLLNTAINYNRAIKHCPYQDMKFNIVIPLTLMDEIDFRISLIFSVVPSYNRTSVSPVTQVSLNRQREPLHIIGAAAVTPPAVVFVKERENCFACSSVR